MRPSTTTPKTMNRTVMVVACPRFSGHFLHLSELRDQFSLHVAQKRPSWPSAHEGSP